MNFKEYIIDIGNTIIKLNRVRFLININSSNPPITNYFAAITTPVST